MKILFLIGNGFDLNLGMKTSYADFYEYYVSQRSKNRHIQNLKDKIENDRKLENWADLEIALGDYTKNLKSEKEFIEIFVDIEDELADYLEDIEQYTDFNQFDRTKLLNYLTYPENSLPTASKNKLIEFRKNWNSTQWDINIITFNYTRSIEKLLDYSGKPIDFSNQIRRNRTVLLNKIEHLHGFTNERMVLGVNDVSQIANTSFHNQRSVLENLVKPDCNQAQGHTFDDWCREQIQKADLICIFGLSIGDSDNYWWDFVGEQLKRDSRIIIFDHGDSIPQRRPQMARDPEREKKQYFLAKSDLSDEELEVADQKLFLTMNSNMFQLKK